METRVDQGVRGEEVAVKLPYEAPRLEEQDEMIFPEEVWQQFSGGHWCFGCTNCNCN